MAGWLRSGCGRAELAFLHHHLSPAFSSKGAFRGPELSSMRETGYRPPPCHPSRGSTPRPQACGQFLLQSFPRTKGPPTRCSDHKPVFAQGLCGCRALGPLRSPREHLPPSGPESPELPLEVGRQEVRRAGQWRGLSTCWAVSMAAWLPPPSSGYARCYTPVHLPSPLEWCLGAFTQCPQLQAS